MTMGSMVTITPEGAINEEREMCFALFVVPCLAWFVYPSVTQGLVEQCHAALLTGLVGWAALLLFDQSKETYTPTSKEAR